MLAEMKIEDNFRRHLYEHIAPALFKHTAKITYFGWPTEKLPSLGGDKYR